MGEGSKGLIDCSDSWLWTAPLLLHVDPSSNGVCVCMCVCVCVCVCPLFSSLSVCVSAYRFCSGPALNAHSSDNDIVMSAVFAGLYPNVVRAVLPRATFAKVWSRLCVSAQACLRLLSCMCSLTRCVLCVRVCACVRVCVCVCGLVSG